MGTRPAANMGTLPRSLWGMAWEVDAGQSSSEEHFFCTSLGALCAGSAQVTLFFESRWSCDAGCTCSVLDVRMFRFEVWVGGNSPCLAPKELG